MIFNISIDCSTLNIFSSLFFQIQQITERANVFSKRYNILDFSSFLYLPQITQDNFFTLVIKNVLVLFHHSSRNLKEEINLYNQANFYLLT